MSRRRGTDNFGRIPSQAERSLQEFMEQYGVSDTDMGRLSAMARNWLAGNQGRERGSGIGGRVLGTPGSMGIDFGTRWGRGATGGGVDPVRSFRDMLTGGGSGGGGSSGSRSYGSGGGAGGFLGGMGGGKGGGGDLARQYQTALDKANAANEERYKEIKGRYEQRRSRAMAEIEKVGEQERKDLSKRFAEAGGRARQGLRARGLGSTSIMPSIEAGIAREETEAAQRLEDALTRERLAYDTGLEGDTLGFMERREDISPDLGLLAQLYSGVGEAQIGGVAGGYGGYGGGSSYGGRTAGSGSDSRSMLSAAARTYGIGLPTKIRKTGGRSPAVYSAPKSGGSKSTSRRPGYTRDDSPGYFA